MGAFVSTPTTTAERTPAPSAVRSRRRSRAAADVAVPYDFSRPLQLSREHQRMLQLAFDGFGRQVTTVFTSMLRSVCSVTLRGIDQRTYAEYVQSLPGTTYLTLFTAEPVPGRGILEMPLESVMACVDHMLGGPGSARQPQRPLTEIESGVISGLMDRLFGEMRYSLGAIAPIEPVVVGVEYSPQFAQAAGASDVVVVVDLELRIDDRPHRMTVCLPFVGLLPHLTAASAPAPVSGRERAKRAHAAELLRQQFEHVPVDVAVRCRPTTLTPQVFAGLRPGDVIRLGHPASAPLDVAVDGTVFAHATAGTQGPRLAALIVATPKETS